MIGFFDSGLGGLTILQEVIKQRPSSYMYLGDNTRAPYGSRSQAEILQFTTEGVKWLIDRGCMLVVIACNTASANALRVIQQTWLLLYAPKVRVLGILVPTIEVMIQTQSLTNEKPSFLIFATPSTVASGAYEREIHKRLPNAKVRSIACPQLVPLIESGADRNTLKKEIIKYIPLEVALNRDMPDAILLGCTHYALIEDLFRECLGKEANVLSQPTIVTKSLLHYLQRHPEFDARESKKTDYFTTADPVLTSELSQRFFPDRVVYRRIELP